MKIQWRSLFVLPLQKSQILQKKGKYCGRGRLFLKGIIYCVMDTDY